MLPPFDPNKMRHLYLGNSYESPNRRVNWFVRTFPSLSFNARIYSGPTRWLIQRARAGFRDAVTWVYASDWVLEVTEWAGTKVRVDGLDVFKSFEGPCVITANHMSTLETFLLPGMLRPRFKVTFVVKRSLVEGNGFGLVMRGRKAIAVDRKNPREDLTTVLKEGCERIKEGYSIILFPQSTRKRYFNEKEFNSIAEKLARKAGVPLVPLAVKTDAWGQGNLIRQLGKITPNHEALFRFFPAMRINGNGHEEHSAIVDVLSKTLRYWEWRQDLMDAGHEPAPWLDPKLELPEIFKRGV